MTDSDTSTQSDNTKPSMNLHIAIAAVIVVVLIGIYFLNASSDKAQPTPPPAPQPVVTQPEPVVEEAPVMEEEPIVLPETPEPAETMPTETIEPEAPVLDISDAAVKTAVVALSEMPELARVLVDDDLLRRFVVFSNNLAENEVAESHRFLHVPDAGFRVYRQADKEWIDAASFKRYTVYAEALDSIEVENLMALYEEYKPALNEIYLEIGDPDDPFSERLLTAIDHLLDTPEIPVPVEVYSDSVMYKYRNERIEALSGPQKQLLRTGPENMRLIKAKLREIQASLQTDEE